MKRAFCLGLLVSLVSLVPVHAGLDFESSGTDQWRSYTSSPITVHPVTLAALIKAESHAAVGTILEIGTDQTAASEDTWALRWNTTPALLARTVTNGSGSSSTSAASTDGVWHYVAGVFANTTSRIAYLDGVAAADQTTSRNPNGGDHLSIGRSTFTDAPTNYFDGVIAHATIWNVALTPQEVLSIARGAHPCSVRPGSIVFYEPLTGHARDFVGQRAGTTNGAAALVEGPPIGLLGGPH